MVHLPPPSAANTSPPPPHLSPSLRKNSLGLLHTVRVSEDRKFACQKGRLCLLWEDAGGGGW